MIVTVFDLYQRSKDIVPKTEQGADYYQKLRNDIAHVIAAHAPLVNPRVSSVSNLSECCDAFAILKEDYRGDNKSEYIKDHVFPVLDRLKSIVDEALSQSQAPHL